MDIINGLIVILAQFGVGAEALVGFLGSILAALGYLSQRLLFYFLNRRKNRIDMAHTQAETDLAAAAQLKIVIDALRLQIEVLTEDNTRLQAKIDVLSDKLDKFLELVTVLPEVRIGCEKADCPIMNKIRKVAREVEEVL
jgi:hypothetical protein